MGSLLSGSIADNIRLRNYQISDPQIHSAAKYANAHQFISRLPHQYEENIKERGTNLSSGELQLLSFARAIAFKPQILILDEATREVDPETEALIQEAISKLLHNRTALVIAHRLATIKIVDRIIVLHKGKIVEQGTHNELFEKNGLYATLYKLQYKNKNRH
ncbi:MAG: ATP-binding cassette domain-containing protein [Candidatus Stahlbacteria bacterium]|nr:ATP-binding cassette domain-containing protein [Candidatus Stahlbacteria bacterium]